MIFGAGGLGDGGETSGIGDIGAARVALTSGGDPTFSGPAISINSGGAGTGGLGFTTPGTSVAP